MKSKRDTTKIYRYALLAFEWVADFMPPKKHKQIKKKSRQHGKKEIRKALKDYE